MPHGLHDRNERAESDRERDHPEVVHRRDAELPPGDQQRIDIQCVHECSNTMILISTLRRTLHFYHV
jgi:hypothetical protein